MGKKRREVNTETEDASESAVVEGLGQTDLKEVAVQDEGEDDEEFLVPKKKMKQEETAVTPKEQLPKERTEKPQLLKKKMRAPRWTPTFQVHAGEDGWKRVQQTETPGLRAEPEETPLQRDVQTEEERAGEEGEAAEKEQTVMLCVWHTGHFSKRDQKARNNTVLIFYYVYVYGSSLFHEY